MAWIVGIDEAGYGPNLGPMVQSAVAMRVPDPSTNLWETLQKVARRADDADDGRLAIDDSKAVNNGPNGFARLELGVLSVFSHTEISVLGEWIKQIAVNGSAEDMAGETWYGADQSLPIEIEGELFQAAASSWRSAIADAGIEVALPRCVITPTPRFNEVLTEHGTKAAVTGRGMIALIADFFERADEPVHFTIDKLGGRNFYAAMIQTAIPDGWVTIIKESAESSEYHIHGLKVPVHITIRPRAESEQMTVALASMLSKYLREVFMKQFNAYWLTHLPGLTPTAGYPSDAKRFYDAIHPVCKKLGMEKHAVWREK